MAETPKDRTPLVVRAEQSEWDQFNEHLESVRANDNRTWTRDFYPDQARGQQEPNPEIDRVLEGLLTPRHETLLERIEREAREKGQDLSQAQERDHDRSDDLGRW